MLRWVVVDLKWILKIDSWLVHWVIWKLIHYLWVFVSIVGKGNRSNFAFVTSRISRYKSRILKGGIMLSLFDIFHNLV